MPDGKQVFLVNPLFFFFLLVNPKKSDRHSEKLEWLYVFGNPFGEGWANIPPKSSLDTNSESVQN
jgi:hypothetical protein